MANEKHIWVWRSLVACLNGVQEAGSSNLLTQTEEVIAKSLLFLCFGAQFVNVNENLSQVLTNI